VHTFFQLHVHYGPCCCPAGCSVFQQKQIQLNKSKVNPLTRFI